MCSAAAISSTLYVLPASGALHEYAIHKSTWTSLASAPASREYYGAGFGVLGSAHLFVIGGLTELDGSNNVSAYHIGDQDWFDLPPMTLARSFGGMASWKSHESSHWRIVVAGGIVDGNSGLATDRVEEYGPSWPTALPTTLPTALPTPLPSSLPTASPSHLLTTAPSPLPTPTSAEPSPVPFPLPTAAPTFVRTDTPTAMATYTCSGTGHSSRGECPKGYTCICDGVSNNQRVRRSLLFGTLAVDDVQCLCYL